MGAADAWGAASLPLAPLPPLKAVRAVDVWGAAGSLLEEPRPTMATRADACSAARSRLQHVALLQHVVLLPVCSSPKAQRANLCQRLLPRAWSLQLAV